MSMNTAKRLASILLTLSMLLSLAACGGDGGEKGGAQTATLDNGNVITAPAEEGSEAELTAVREELIKKSELKGFGEVDKMEFYENGVRTTSDKYVQVKDNKKIYYAGDLKRVVNYTDGYILDIPADWTPDFTLSSARSTYSNDEVTLAVSDESEALDIYGSPEEYLNTVFRFINTENYFQKNRVEKLLEETIAIDDELSAFVLKLHLKETLEGTKCYYTYVVCYNELRITHLMFKAVDDRDFSEVYTTLQAIYDKGAAVDTLSYPESPSPSWNEDTLALYNELQARDTVMWGLVNGNLQDDPLKVKYPILEKKLDFKFPIVTTYTDTMGDGFPVEQARKIDKDGRVVQFTYHFDYRWGNTMGQNAPILDVYRGELDDEFRAFAKGVVEYGRPMFFRVNNEMNSDWTSWAAVNAMCDPDIFVATWQRMYNIFEEEGANQFLIWVWNPQGASTGPVTNWNDLRLYMPGAKYVDMLGLTAYNFGEDMGWASFEDYYTALENYYKPLFGDWAWIIGEFGCSDAFATEEQAGRRAEWITQMFDCFEQGMYPNIKAAVWFNANDYDGNGNIVHEIALGRDPAAMEAFKDGLARTQE